MEQRANLETGRFRGGRRTWRKAATKLLLTLPAVALLGACDDDDNPTEVMDDDVMFDVRIENVSAAYDFTSTGVFNTPAGADAPGPLASGNSYDFTFHAGPGSYVSFASMFVQSNDLFYAPAPMGIAVFDGDGNPRSGDITSEVYLWDAGTELNEEPGAGASQAPRQGGPDSGAADTNPNVRIAADEFMNLPEVDEAIQVTLTHLGGTEFRIRIANIADAEALEVSAGGFAPVLLAPGVWTVGGADDALFSDGQPDPGYGLEGLAEDGAVSGYNSQLMNKTGITSPIAPGVYAVHTGGSVLFMAGDVDRGEGMEALAEDGDPSGLAAAVAAHAQVYESGVFNTPDGGASPAPAFPGDSYSFTIMARPGDRLSLATMFVQSNDLFYAPAEAGLALFDSNGMPYSGDVTGMFLLWDAGTEVNEAPGVGLYQAPRQAGADTGDTEIGAVRQVNDGYTYPEVDRIIRVTLTPMSSGS